MKNTTLESKWEHVQWSKGSKQKIKKIAMAIQLQTIALEFWNV